jgi:membrane protein involved in colicin uptake
MTELELILTVTTLLSLLGIVFAMVESNQQKRSARSQSVHAQALTDRLGRAHQILEELRNITKSKDTIINSLLEQRDEAQAKVVELTQLLNNNQEYILALEDKAIAKKASEKKKAPAKKAAPKKSKKG